jgi:hypothetical protein
VDLRILWGIHSGSIKVWTSVCRFKIGFLLHCLLQRVVCVWSVVATLKKITVFVLLCSWARDKMCFVHRFLTKQTHNFVNHISVKPSIAWHRFLPFDLAQLYIVRDINLRKEISKCVLFWFAYEVLKNIRTRTGVLLHKYLTSCMWSDRYFSVLKCTTWFYL